MDQSKWAMGCGQVGCVRIYLFHAVARNVFSVWMDTAGVFTASLIQQKLSTRLIERIQR